MFVGAHSAMKGTPMPPSSPQSSETSQKMGWKECKSWRTGRTSGKRWRHGCFAPELSVAMVTCTRPSLPDQSTFQRAALIRLSGLQNKTKQKIPKQQKERGGVLKGKVMTAPTTSSDGQLRAPPHPAWKALLHFRVSPGPTADREF